LGFISDEQFFILSILLHGEYTQVVFHHDLLLTKKTFAENKCEKTKAGKQIVRTSTSSISLPLSRFLKAQDTAHAEATSG